MHIKQSKNKCIPYIYLYNLIFLITEVLYMYAVVNPKEIRKLIFKRDFKTLSQLLWIKKKVDKTTLLKHAIIIRILQCQKRTRKPWKLSNKTGIAECLIIFKAYIWIFYWPSESRLNYLKINFYSLFVDLWLRLRFAHTFCWILLFFFLSTVE